MSTIKINGKKYEYKKQELINFDEGLIGLPKMRRAALIPLAEFAPFCWLASVDDDRVRFIVVNPREVYSDYESSIESMIPQADSNQMPLTTLAIVKICSDWQKTTINLRAPIFVNQETRQGTQFILSDSNYKLAEALPQGSLC